MTLDQLLDQRRQLVDIADATQIVAGRLLNEGNAAAARRVIHLGRRVRAEADSLTLDGEPLGRMSA